MCVGDMLKEVGDLGTDVKRGCVCYENAERRNLKPETKAEEMLTRTDLGGNLLASRAGLETVLGAAADVLKVAHTAGTGGLSALSLLAPLVRADLSGGVTARGADLLLTVEGTGVASSADGVRLGAIG